jgi:hypothetical protein
VLTKTNTIEVYDRLSGALLHKWPITGGIGENGVGPQLDASGGIAVYIAGPSLHALDLLTGKVVVLATHRAMSEDEINSAQIDYAGLLYDYNMFGAYAVRGTYYVRGRVVFIPYATVAKSVGR